MGKLFLSFLVASILSLTALSACETNKEKCDIPNCKMEKKQKNCDMKEIKKEASCGAGKCGAGMMKSSQDKMASKSAKKMSGSCGAGKCGASMMKSSKDEMSGNSGKKMSGSCGAGKCGGNMMKKAKMCGCGMTQKSCKKMMISCKFREAKEIQNK